MPVVPALGRRRRRRADREVSPGKHPWCPLQQGTLHPCRMQSTRCAQQERGFPRRCVYSQHMERCPSRTTGLKRPKSQACTCACVRVWACACVCGVVEARGWPVAFLNRHPHFFFQKGPPARLRAHLSLPSHGGLQACVTVPLPPLLTEKKVDSTIEFKSSFVQRERFTT